MPKMYRVFAFWTIVFALLAAVGGMPVMALIFFANTALFLALSYMNLSEKGYMISNGYGDLKDKTFRISHMADYTLDDVNGLLNTIKDILNL